MEQAAHLWAGCAPVCCPMQTARTTILLRSISIHRRFSVARRLSSFTPAIAMSRQSTLPFVDPKRQRTEAAPAAEAKVEGAAPAAAPSSAAGSSAAAPIAVDDDDASFPDLAAAIAASKVPVPAARSSAASSSSGSMAAKPQSHKGAGSAAAAAAPSSAASASSSSASSASSASSSGFRLEIRAGDLFSCPASTSLAHCVSQCLAMGKGIAVEFKSRFKGLAELKAQSRKVGEVAVLQPSKSRFVYYLITKPRYFHKPTYDDLESSLQAMATHMAEHHVTALAMPRIGCGLDGLQWPKVEALIRKVFGKMNVSITVFTGP